jgi:endonuclease/exonuclease/phosphatase (EEP) superfamily protein YafD
VGMGEDSCVTATSRDTPVPDAPGLRPGAYLRVRRAIGGGLGGPVGPARRLGIWAAGSTLAGAAIPTLSRLSGYDTLTPLPQLVAFAPYATGVTALVLGVGVVLRSRWIPTAATVLLAAQVALVLPRFLPNAAAQAPASAPGQLRVMTVNLFAGQADTAALAASIRRNAPDILALEEITPEVTEALDQAGLAQLLPYRMPHPEWSVSGVSLYSRLPLREQGMLDEPTTFAMPWVTVEVAGRTVRVIAIHTFPPLLGRVQDWSRDMGVVRREAGRPQADAQIMLGDFNATMDHALFRDLLDTGLTDVHDALGRGIVRTWPAEGSAVPLIPLNVPLVHLDHVLMSSQVKAVAVHEEAIPGTDHRAVIAELRVSGDS